MKETIVSLISDIKANDKEVVDEFSQIYAKHSRRYQVITLRDINRKNYYFVVRIVFGSFKNKTLYYDVVLQATSPKNSPSNIFDKKLRFFSNSPSFSFTYTYVFNQHNLLIPWLKGKYTRDMLHTKPRVRNKDERVDLDRSIKYALLYLDRVYKYANMEETSFSARIAFRNILKENSIYKAIPTALEKTAENKRAGQDEREKKERRKRRVERIKRPITSRRNRDTNKKNVKKATYSTTNRQSSKIQAKGKVRSTRK